MRKSFAFNRIISFLLVMVMVIIMVPTHFFPKAAEEAPSTVSDRFIRSGDVSVQGKLPRGTLLKAKTVDNPFALDIEEFHAASLKGASFVDGISPAPVTDEPAVPENSTYSRLNYLGFYDISLYKGRSEIQPDGQVKVTINNIDLSNAKGANVIHILDSADAIRDALTRGTAKIVKEPAFVNAFPTEAELAEQVTGESGAIVIEETAGEINDARNAVTFYTHSFSIFAISDEPILTVNFYKGAKSTDNKIVSIRVKARDAEDPDVFKKIIYDPGIDYASESNKDIIFRGWFENNNYTVADAENNALTIAKVREKIIEKLSSNYSDGDYIDFFAMLYVQYTATYFDEAGNVCLGRDFVLQRYDEAENEVDYQVTLNYVPYGQFENFEGWKLKSGDKAATGDGFYTSARENLVGIYEGGSSTTPSGALQTGTINGVDVHDYVYITPTWTRIQGDIYLYAHSPAGHWLVFDENGKGATYVAPQFVEDLEVTTDPANYTEAPVEMARFGYSFDGWYLPSGYEQIDDGQGNMVNDITKPLKDEDGNVILGERFVFGNELTENLTIYAKWIPSPTAAYTVIVWMEKSGDTYENNVSSGEREYDFYTSFTFTGNTGATVTAVSNATSTASDINGTYPNARIRGTQINGQQLDRTITITGYHQNTEKTQTQTKIVPEGTSVINVYYDRHTVRYTFYYPFGAASSTYEKYTGNSAGMYYIKNGNNYDGPYYMTFSNGVWTYETGEFIYTPYEGSESGSYYIDGEDGKELIELTRVGDEWTYQVDAYGYHIVNPTTSGYYYIPDGNGGYTSVYLTRSGNSWTYGTGEYEYVVSTSTDSGYYYIPDGNGGYRQVYLTRQSNGTWIINNEYDYIYTPTTANGNSQPEQYGFENGEYFRIYYGRNSVWNDRSWWKTRTNIGWGYYEYSDPYNGTRYTRTQQQKVYSGEKYVHLEITATYTGDIYENGSYQRTEVYDGTVYTGEEVIATHTGEVYVPAAGGNRWRLYYQQTGLYGEKLNWPTDTGIWWYPNGSNTGGTSGTRMTYKSNFLPLDTNMDVTYYGSRGNGNNEIRFYTQDLSGGDNYTLQIAVSSNATTFNINDKFTGFEAYQYRSQSNGRWSNWTNVGTLNPQSGIYGSAVNINSILEIRYRRLSNKITFLDGKYVNGNNIDQDETLRPTAFDTTAEMFVDTDISSYNVGGSNYFVPQAYHSEYVFGGWYADDACTHPYTFTTMQLTGVTVYAKWVQVQYRVFLHPNAGSANAVVNGETKDTRDMSLDWGSDTQAMNFRVNYGSAISVPTGRRDEYYFAGWFTDPECTKSFIPATELNEQTVTSLYDKSADMTDVMDKWGDLYGDSEHDGPWNSDIIGNDGGDRFWITKKIDLYAKWRRKIVGAEGLYIKYVTTDDPNHGTGETVGSFDDGSTEFCDGDLYVDRAFAYGLAACNAPENHDPELHFAYWVIQEWNADTGKFEDSNKIIYPGERFDVSFEYAQRIDVNPSDPTYNKKGTEGYNEELPEHYYDYYMVIRAEYVEATPQDTTITYDANGGSFTATPTGYTATVVGGYNTVSTTLIVNDPIDILPGTVVTREGYTFMGWSLERNGDKFLDGGETNYSADNLTTTPDGNDPSNTLYAIWEITRYKVDVKKLVTNNGWTPAGTEEFVVNYSVTFPEGYTRNANKDVPASGSITLTANGTETIENIPHGSTITVTENPYGAFDTSYSVSQTIANITSDGAITITNVRKLAKVTVKKVVVGFDADKASTNKFAFTATATLNGTTIGLNSDDASFSLANGESQVIEVPAGAIVTVTEGDYSANYYTDVNTTLNTRTYTSLALAKDANDEVTFTNTRKVTVKAVKVIDNSGSSDTSWNNFAFPVTFSDGTTGTVIAGDDAGATTTVRFGTTVSVTEDTSAKNNGVEVRTVFDTTYSGSVEAITEEPVITITNTRKVFTVKVTKTAEGFADGRTFNFTSTGLGSDSFTLGNGGTKTFENIPYGTVITVTEADGGAEYIGTRDIFGGTVNGENITVDSNVTINYNNAIQSYPVIVTKTVTSLDPDDTDPAKKTFTITVNYTLPNGTSSSVTLTLGNGQKNTDTAINKPIFLPYGSTYTVTETLTGNDAVNFLEPVITNGSGTVTGDTNVTVKNERDTVEIDVAKVVTYSGDANTAFNFHISAPGVDQNVTAKQGTNSGKVIVPKGAAVTITETGDLSAWTVTSTAAGNNGNEEVMFDAKADTTATFTNKREPVKVTVTKVLTPIEGITIADDNTKTFPVKIVYTDDNGVVHNDNVVDMVNGQSVEVMAQYGSTVTVSETVDANFKTPVITVNKGTISEGSVAATEEKTVTVTNERDTVKVTVTKTVDQNADTTTQFDFTAVATLNGKAVTLKSGEDSFKLKSGESKVITLPKGAVLTVTEATNANFYATVDGVAGNVKEITTPITEATRINFVNYKTQIVQVKKVFESNVEGDDQIEFDIVVTYLDEKGAEKTKTLKLKAGDTSEEIIVRYGSNVTVKETAPVGFKPVADATYTITEDKTGEKVLVVTNERVVYVTVRKILDSLDSGNDFTFEYSYTYKDTEVKQQITIEDVPVDTTGKAYAPVIEIPYGAEVTVTETTADGYSTFVLVPGGSASTEGVTGTAVITSGTAAQPAEFVFTNHRVIPFTIIKTVDSDETTPVTEYSFTVAYNYNGTADSRNAAVNVSDGDTTGDGIYTGTTTIYIPYGAANVTVTEKPETGYDTEAEGHINGSPAQGANTGSSEYVKNIYTFTDAITRAADVAFVNTRMVEVTVIKELDSEETDAMTSTFNFNYTYTGTNHETIQAVPFTVTMQNALTGSTVIRVPYGVTLTVNELVDQTNYDTYYGFNGAATGTAGTTAKFANAIVDNNSSVKFSNKRMVNVKIIKNVDDPTLNDAEGTANNAYTFTYTYTYNNTPNTSAPVVITVDTTSATGNTGYFRIPYNAANFVVTETIDLSVFDVTATSTGTKGTLDGAVYTLSQNVTAVNTDITFNNQRMVEVEVVKKVESSEQADKDAAYSVTYGYTRAATGRIAAAVNVTGKTGTIKDATDGKLTVRMPYGSTFTVTETGDLSKFQVLYSTTDNTALTEGKEVSLADVTAAKTVTFTNRKLYTVTVRKHVDNTVNGVPVTDGLDTEAFDFTYIVGGTVGYNTASDGSTFSLTNYVSGATPVAEKVITLPYGASFVLEEIDTANFSGTGYKMSDLFTVKYADAQGNLGDDGFSIGRVIADTVAHVYNTRNTREITVKKTLDSQVAADFHAYTFNWAVANWTSGAVTLTPVTQNETVSDKVIVPVGLQVTVTEDNTKPSASAFVGMDTTARVGNGEAAEGYTGTVPAGLENVTVYFVNTRVTADLTITKTIDGDISKHVPALEGRTFMFRITANENGYTYDHIVMIKGAGSVTISQLQTGYNYTVTEITGWSYEFDASGAYYAPVSAPANITNGTNDYTVTFLFVENGEAVFSNAANDTNWLRGEAYADNRFDPNQK